MSKDNSFDGIDRTTAPSSFGAEQDAPALERLFEAAANWCESYLDESRAYPTGARRHHYYNTAALRDALDVMKKNDDE